VEFRDEDAQAADAARALEREAARIAADPEDRREIAAIRKLLDEVSEPWSVYAEPR
jgi:DNA-binding GntR family transcriptional regulator